MLRFSLFGFPVSVHWMFWVVVAMLGGGLEANTPHEFQILLLWVLAAFISIVIHELGHAFLQRRFGARVQIHLYAFGGLAIPDRGFTRQQHILVSLAGPAVQIVFGLIFRELMKHSTGDVWPIRVFLTSFAFISILWATVNLIPVFPLDGGQVLRGVLGPSNDKITYTIGIVCAVGLALFCLLVQKSTWNTIICGMLAWDNYKLLQGERPPSIFRP